MSGFRLPTEVVIGKDMGHILFEWLYDQHFYMLMYVYDPNLKDQAQSDIQLLKECGFKAESFSEVEANPRVQTVDRLVQRIKDHGSDVVIALGGGSVMDAAKAAAMLAKNPGGALDYIGTKHFQNGSLPTVMMPTTCGTGSEVTWVSVLTDEASQRKISIKGQQMFPTLALVDSNRLKTLPKHLLAWTAMDALTHALEATTGSCANLVSDALAEKAIQLIFKYLPRAYRAQAADEEALLAVMRASTLAGMAFGNADVAGVHCLSESLGALYDTPHGLANAVLLQPVLASHQPYIDQRLEQLDQVLGNHSVPSAAVFMARLQQLAADCQIPDFQSLKVPRKDFAKLAKMATANGSNSSNPRPMQEKDYLEILTNMD